MLPQLTYGCMVRETRVTSFTMILMTQMPVQGSFGGVLRLWWLGGSAAMGAVHKTVGSFEATGSVGYVLKLVNI
jgi:hypothetical protein